MNWMDMWSPQSIAEDEEVMQARGIAGGDEFLEKAYWDSPEEAQIAAGAQLNEPEKAEPLAKSVTAAKQSGQQGGIGIVPAIFAGLAGAFSDDGVATTSKLLKEWDPKTREAQRVERQGKAQKVEQDRLDMDRTAQQRDPESEASRGQMKDYAAMFDGMDMPQLGSMFVGKSVEQQDKMFESLAPQLKDAIGKQERQQDRDIKSEYNTAMLAQTKAKQAATAQQKEDAAGAKVAAAATKVMADTEKQANAKRLTQYETLASSEAKYQGTIRDVDRIIELGDEVETGPIAGSAPVVYLRKMFGDNELQELESLVKGLPLPVLKATFGAAFTVKEGETLAQSLANVNMDAQTFRNRMQALRENVELSHNEYIAQTKHLVENNGNLLGYVSDIPLNQMPTQYTEGQTATGANGEKMIFTNGNWEAM